MAYSYSNYGRYPCDQRESLKLYESVCKEFVNRENLDDYGYFEVDFRNYGYDLPPDRIEFMRDYSSYQIVFRSTSRGIEVRLVDHQNIKKYLTVDYSEGQVLSTYGGGPTWVDPEKKVEEKKVVDKKRENIRKVFWQRYRLTGKRHELLNIQ